MASTLRAKSLRSGEALRGDLCAASGSQLPRGWPEPTLNRLLDFADVPKDARDPLGFKQALAEIAPALGGLPLRARKEMLTALAAHASAARAAAVPDRFGEWPPPEPTPPPRPRKKEEPRADPTAGDGGGYRWTQSETDLTIAVAVPDGTTKSEVLLQLAPSHGPATRLVLRARFWPQPLVAGELHAEVEASECMWHLSADTHEIVIDLPKVRPSLWPAILAPLPAIASKPAPPPVAGGVPHAAAEGAPPPPARLDVVVQRMGQRPRDLAALRECIAAIEANIDPASPAAAEAAAAQTAVRAAGGGGGDGGADAGSAVAVSAKEAADGAVVAALNARAVPLLLRAVRMHGQLREVTADAWRLLCSLMRGRGFVKKIAADGGAMGLLLPALRSHMRDAPTAAQLVLAVRMLLPAVPPKPFVLDGGVETLCDAVRAHPTGAVAGVGVRALQMLASLNDVVRASVLEAEVLRKLLVAIETVGARADADADGGASAAEEAALVGPTVGLVAQLARGDAPLLARLRLQAPAAEVLRLCVRQAGSEEVQADGARALAGLIGDAASAAELVDGGGFAQLEAVHDTSIRVLDTSRRRRSPALRGGGRAGGGRWRGRRGGGRAVALAGDVARGVRSPPLPRARPPAARRRRGVQRRGRGQHGVARARPRQAACGARGGRGGAGGCGGRGGGSCCGGGGRGGGEAGGGAAHRGGAVRTRLASRQAGRFAVRDRRLWRERGAGGRRSRRRREGRARAGRGSGRAERRRGGAGGGGQRDGAARLRGGRGPPGQ